MSHKTFDDPNSIEARQHLLDNRCEHATKRHRVRKRRIRLSAQKKSCVAAKVAAQKASYRRYKSSVRAYWSGEREEHP